VPRNQQVRNDIKSYFAYNRLRPLFRHGNFMQYIFLLGLFVVPLWRICKRAGFQPELSLVALVPGIGVGIVGAVLSFQEWKLPDTETDEIENSEDE